MSEFVKLHKGVLRLPNPDPDGRGEIPVQQIGKGFFTTAYVTVTGTPYVYLRVRERGNFGDSSKAILAFANQVGDHSPYIPRVAYMGEESNTSDHIWYRMPFYKAPLRKGDSPEAWAQYKILKECRDSALPATFGRRLSGYQQSELILKCVEQSAAPRGLVEALATLIGHAVNYGAGYTLEFSPRNLATTENGHLVLLDILFDSESVDRKRALAVKRPAWLR